MFKQSIVISQYSIREITSDQPMLFELSQLNWYLNGTGITTMHLSTKCTFTKGFVCYVSILANETI